MASDRHVSPDGATDRRTADTADTAGDPVGPLGLRVDERPVEPAVERGADRLGARPDGGADRTGQVRHGDLSELYRDDPDDIFTSEFTEVTGEAPVRPPGRRRMRLDDRLDARRTARDILEAFDPGRLDRAGARQPQPDRRVAGSPGLPELTDGVDRRNAGPLSHGERCVRRIYAAFGGSGFHGAERHEGSLDDRDHLLRLVERQDPAQPDQERRARGIDAFKKGNGKHVCAESSTSICDPVAYAVALVRGIDHPRVRAALDARHDPPRRPHYVQVPIVELLGESGAQFCRGYQLVGDDPREAVRERDAWAKAGWKGKPRDDLRQPPTEQIATFHDGVIEFRIGHNAARDRYELISMFPRPRREPTEGSDRD